MVETSLKLIHQAITAPAHAHGETPRTGRSYHGGGQCERNGKGTDFDALLVEINRVVK
jgi:hypothetical protein